MTIRILLLLVHSVLFDNFFRWVKLNCLCAYSTDSLTRSEIPPPLESAHQQREVCLQSRVIPRLEDPNVIGGIRSPLFSFKLID